MQNHRIPLDQLAELCAGGGGVETMRTLYAGQRSRRLLLLDTVVREVLDDPAVMGPLPAAAAAWEALVAADRAASAMCTRLLLHPQVGSWAAYVLRRKRGVATADAPFWIDAGVLHALALVASVRAGLSWRTRLPARTGRVMIPTLGMAWFCHLPPWSHVTAECDRGEIRLHAAGRELVVPAESARDAHPDLAGSAERHRAAPGPAEREGAAPGPAGPDREAGGWWPLRRLGVGEDARLSLFLDDIDPFRELAGPVEPQRLDDEEVARWQTLLAGAWALLCGDQAELAAPLAEGIASLVPLPPDQLGTTGSASPGEAFGSVMISPPVDGVDLAVSLVQEFQHLKLGGLMHLTALTDGDERPVWRAPWRDDPGPLGGLVRDVYAFVGTAEFWRTRRWRSAGVERRVADFEFAYARTQVLEALHALAAADGLTDVGRRLLDGLAERVDSWRGAEVDPVAAGAADLICAAHRAEWRLRHLRPAENEVDRLAAAWPAGSPVAGPGGSVVVAGPAERWSRGWPDLARAYVTGRLGGRPGPAPASRDDQDVALLTGDRQRAHDGYLRRVVADPGDVHAWAGLSLTAGAREALRLRPEVVRAVHRALRRQGRDAEPPALSRWLTRSAGSAAGPVLP